MRILCDGILETIQRYNYEGQLKHSFTAHPKIDPESGKACLTILIAVALAQCIPEATFCPNFMHSCFHCAAILHYSRFVTALKF